MGQKLKFAVIGLVCLLIASFVIILQVNNSAKSLERKVADLNGEIANLRKQVEQAGSDKRQYEDKLKSIQQEIDKSVNEKKQLQETIETLSSEIEKEKEEKQGLQIAFKKEKEDIKDQMKVLEASKTELDSKLKALQEKNKGLEDKARDAYALLKDKTVQLSELERQLDQVRKYTTLGENEGDSSVKLSPIVVRPKEDKSKIEESRPSPTPGRVLAVNRESNFVIINFGRNLGVKVGDTFQIYRAEKIIAGIKVTQIRDSISACDISKENESIKIGDTVK